MKKSLIVIFVVLLLDQILKFWVKMNMTIGESFPVLGDWFQIYFIENNGMAFGWEFGANIGKIALSLFRIIAVALFFYLIYRLSKRNVKFGPLFGISLITAGALGNIIDGLFYGMIFRAHLHKSQLYFPTQEATQDSCREKSLICFIFLYLLSQNGCLL